MEINVVRGGGELYKIGEEGEVCTGGVAEGPPPNADGEERNNPSNDSVHKDDGICNNKPPAVVP